jgi:hypothetical protein
MKIHEDNAPIVMFQRVVSLAEEGIGKVINTDFEDEVF